MMMEMRAEPVTSLRKVKHPPLLLGAGGMLHRAVSSLLGSAGVEHFNFARKELDLSRPETVEAALPRDLSVVINCAAYTNVDQAETEEDLATRVNGVGVGALAEACKRRGALLVHYSTDYVFSGRGTRPYRTDDPRAPIGAYGRSKLVGEEAIEASGCEHLVIRTSWLYAPWGKNFVRTIVAFVRKKHPNLKIVSDQRGRPTSSEQLAEITVKLIEAGARGMFHACDGGECTWLEFAREIGGAIDPAVQIGPCTTAELGRPAPRPAYSVMDLSKTEAVVGEVIDWRMALRSVLAKLED
jgi:dTDP-4-dehydrorhamnose reductase